MKRYRDSSTANPDVDRWDDPQRTIDMLALKGGAVAFYGPADEFMNEDILYNIYEKSFSLMQHPQYGRTIIAPEVP